MNHQHFVVKNLSKKFISYKKAPGLKGSFESFFKRNPVEKYAVSNFDLEIQPGEVIGLLGPNGAGKTTLMKMFTGIIVPSDGEVSILGHKPWLRAKDFRKKIALVMGQKSQLWWDIPAMDSFELLQKYYEISEKNFKDRIEEMSSLLDVQRLLHVHVRKLSLGERMKMELMASLLHNPELIFLDEPTIGLDLVAQENIRAFINKYRKEHGCSIIITSHYMEDVYALCERLVLIMDGKKSFDGPIHQFENILGNEKVVTLSLDEKPDLQSELLRVLDPRWSEKKKTLEVRIKEEDFQNYGKRLFNELSIHDFNTEKMPIERVMKTLMTNPEVVSRK